MNEADYLKVGVVPAYFQLAGTLVSKLAWVDQTLNEVIATDAGVLAADRTAFADQELLSVPLRKKLERVAPISARILGPR